MFADSLSMKNRGIFLFIFAVCLFYATLRLVAIWHIPFVGDEPDDLIIVRDDFHQAARFFARSYEPHQARLETIVSTPLAALLHENALIPNRILFLIFNGLFLFYNFKLILLATKDKVAAWGYFFLLLTSTFLASFSIFAGSQGDSLYLFFHAASLYYFYRNYLELKQTGIFRNYLFLALLLGACMASKFFGLLLLFSFFLFHLLDRASPFRMTVVAIDPKQMIKAGVLFLCSIFLIGAGPLSSLQKLSLALSAGLFYFGYVLHAILRQRGESALLKPTNKIEFWIAIGLTSLGLALIFSPIYLNWRNLMVNFSYSKAWADVSSFQQNHFYDIPIALVLKFGLISCSVLLMPVAVFLLRKEKIRFGSFTFLVLLCSGIQALAIASVHTKNVLWLLGVFPFLYLPLVWLWRRSKLEHSKILRALTLLCFSVIILDNNSRYFQWFPYGHLDGAQYGKQFIGMSKPGFVSFEGIPYLYEVLSPFGGKTEDKLIEVNCQVISVSKWSHWFNKLVSDYFAKTKKNNRFHFYTSPTKVDNKADFLISSPLYNPSFEKKIPRSEYELIKTVSVKGIDMISVWRKKSQEGKI